MIALTALGTCSIRPVRRAIAASIRSAPIPEASTRRVTSPSASSVTVATPSRTVASYDLSAAVTKDSRRVAWPMPTTSTPVAIGSRVPAWPTLRVPARRRMRATTSCDVQPAGLSTTTNPGEAGLLVVTRVGVRVAVRVGVAGVGRALARGGGRLVPGPGLA